MFLVDKSLVNLMR